MMVLLRRVIGDTLRAQRLAQHRTLREVSSAARVSLGYLSEVERGQKEASSELLSSICDALGVRLSTMLRDVSDTIEGAELTTATGLEAVGAEETRDLEVVGSGTSREARGRIAEPRGRLDARASAHRVVAAA